MQMKTFLFNFCAFQAKPVNCLTISEAKTFDCNSCRKAAFRLSRCYENENKINW